jgi:hypothetical protein
MSELMDLTADRRVDDGWVSIRATISLTSTQSAAVAVYRSTKAHAMVSENLRSMTDPHDLDVLAERRTAVARSRPVSSVRSTSRTTHSSSV